MVVPVVKRWLHQSAIASLEKAYQGAIAIKQIEDQHFNGNPIGFDPNKGKTTSDYFQTQLDQQLFKVRYHLTRFRFSNLIIDRRPPQTEQENEILDKLAVIESILSRYRDRQNPSDIMDAQVVSRTPKNLNPGEIILGIPRLNRSREGEHNSLIDAMSQIRKELDPQYEEEVLQEIRNQKKEKKIAIKWLLLIILIPLSLQLLSRNFFFEPLLDRYRDFDPQRVEISMEAAERYVSEYSHSKETLEIGELLGMISPEQKQEKLKEIAAEVYQKAGYDSLDAFKNIAADLLGLLSFVILLILGKKQIYYIRRFLDRTFRSLNDLTKVYIFILLTDLFVGFHSAEGWEVILASTARHFGLPENHSFIFMFIATVPVILDSTFKLWIFNYLTRYSPTSVAIYEKMNQ